MKQKISNYLIYFVEAFLTTLAFCSANRIITPEEVSAITSSNNPLILNITKFQLNYLDGYGVKSAIIFIVIAFFFYQINKSRDKSDKRLTIISFLGGALFTIFMTIGNRFLYDVSITNSYFQIFVTVINSIGYFFVFENLIKFFIISLSNKKG